MIPTPDPAQLERFAFSVIRCFVVDRLGDFYTGGAAPADDERWLSAISIAEQRWAEQRHDGAAFVPDDIDRACLQAAMACNAMQGIAPEARIGELFVTALLEKT